MKTIKQEKQYSYLYSANKPPVAEVESGETIIVETEDAFSGWVRSYTDVPKLENLKASNPLVGPIYVKNAEPDDILSISVINMSFPRGLAESRIRPRFGALSATQVTALLNEPTETRFYIYKKDLESQRWNCIHNNALSFEEKPFIGCIGTAPDGEVFASKHVFQQGGNMDIPDVKPGNKIFLPVRVTGAFLYIGDCHVRQGEGEITGTALEAAATVTLTVDLIKKEQTNMRLSWPRIESDSQIMAVGVAGELLNSCRIALRELITWLEELGWDRWDAYHVLSQAAELNAGCIASGANMTMVAKLDKSIISSYLINHK